MARRKPVAAAVGPTKKQVVPNFDQGFFQSLRLKMKDDPFVAPYSQHPYVYAANQAIAAAISQVPFRVYKESNEPSSPSAREAAIRKFAPHLHDDDVEMIASMLRPQERMRELRKHAPWLRAKAMCRAVGVDVIETGPWVELFRNVNPMMTRSQLWEATLVNMNVPGTCFWSLEGRNKLAQENEIPTEIWPRGPVGWSPKLDKASGLIASWMFEFTVDGQEKKVPHELFQVVRFGRYNPYSDTAGLAPFNAVRNEVEQDHYAALFNLAFFKNGATPGGIITSERRLTPDQKAALLEGFEARHSGNAKKAWRPDVFEGGVKYQESSVNHRTMQFGDLREWVRDTILAAYRVPKAMVGLGDYATKATAMAETRAFWETNLLPVVQYMEDLLDSDLFTPKRTGNRAIWGAFDLSTVVALREDLGEKVAVAKGLHELQYPANQINERLELGMEDQPWGDTVLVAGTLVTIEDAVSGKSAKDNADNAKPKPPKEEPDEVDEGDEEADKADDTTEEGKTAAAARAARSAASVGTTLKALGFKSADEFWEALIARVFHPGEAAYEKKFKRFLYELRKAQIGIIDQRGEGASSADFLLFDLSEWQDSVAQRMRPVYKSTFDAAWDEVQEEITAAGKGVAAAPTDNDIAVMIAGLARRVGRTVRTIRNQLKDALADMLKNGGTKEQLKDVVRGLFNRVSSGGKVATISRTETAAAVARAREAAMARRGINRHEWVTAEDERVRDKHVVYGQQGPVNVGTNFADFTGGEYTLERPLDDRAPAGETINCRCVLIPTA